MSRAKQPKGQTTDATSQSVSDYISGLIHQALSAELNWTALFLAERLNGLLPAEEASAYLYALSLLRTNNAQGAIHVLRAVVHPPRKGDSQPPRPQTRQMSNWRQEQNVMRPAMQASLRCAWVYSRACQEAGRPREAEDVLNKAMNKASAKGTLNSNDLQLPAVQGPSVASLHVTRAHCCIRSYLFDEAAQHFMSALQDTWWCWEAFEGLCALGKAPDPDIFYAPKATNNGTYAPVTNQARASPLFTPALTKALGSNSNVPFPLAVPSYNQSFDSNQGNSSFESSFLGTNMLRQASGSSSSGQTTSAGFFTPPASTMPAGLPKANAPNKRAKDAVRRSTRLTGSTHPTPSLGATIPLNGGMLFPAEKPKGKEPRSRVASNPRDKKRAKASSSPPPGPPSSPYATASTNNTGGALPDNAEEWLKAVVRKFAKAEAALSRFESIPAMDAIMSLEVEQRRSWRASVLIARARMEGLDYPGADKAFSAARETAPYMIAHSDLHSTLLWHLSRSTDLSYLAQQIMALSPLSPEAWICTGNVFSLLDDHSNGLKCFKRAIQLVETDEGHASRKSSGTLSGISTGEYPYVMAGHECVALEEWENALGFFREAIQRKPRCYTAWFGLGNVYMKTGKLRLAEYHFTKAVNINPGNAMLVSCVGSIQEKMGKRKEALEMYERACTQAPQSAAVHFKKVKLLVHLKKYKAALQDLLSLSALAPDEFNVQFLLGKVYGHLGNRAQMTKHFTFAQDLDPRSAQRVREAIEALVFEGSEGEDATME